MRNTYFIIYLLLGVTALSCIGHYKYFSELTASDLKWADIYSENEEIYFDSNYGNIDTMFVWDISVNKDCPPYYIDFDIEHGDTYLAGINFHFFITNKSQYKSRGGYLDCSLSVYKELNDSLYLYVCLAQFAVGSNKEINLSDPQTCSKFKWCDKELIDCITITPCDSNYYKSPYVDKSRITKCIVSKEWGLLYYSFDDGEEFTRVFE